jgi:hypothetical protein
LRALFQSLLAGGCLFGAVAAYSQLVANSRYLARSHEVLRLYAQLAPGPDAARREALIGGVARRARVYEAAIEQTHLVDGMLVNRDANGDAESLCDSLLFSSLRYVALKKLGLAAEAETAWAALEQSQNGGLWVRHPRCSDRATSRDMMMGLLIALSQRPDDGEDHVRDLLEQLRKRDGYFSFGPRYVSYMTPTLARLLRVIARDYGVETGAMPDLVKDGYSVEELSVTFIKPGFEAHLVGLAVWLEMEMRADPRAPLLGRINDLTTWASGADLEKQRLQWTTTRLAAIDPSNLFFRYLRLRAADALTYNTAAAMVDELLAMRQFPPERLPSDCDRTADYIWQRGPWERQGNRRCDRTFAGADYLWMAGLLVEALQPGPVYTRARTSEQNQ